MVDELLGPFAVSGEMLLAKKPEDGSLASHDDPFRMLSSTMKAAGVALSGWDWIVLRWLADQDARAVAAVAGWVSRARQAGLAAGGAAAPMANYPDNQIVPPQWANTAAGGDPDPATTRRDLP